MSIEAMKQALEALDAYSWEQVNAARAAIRTAIEQAEKQEPVACQYAVDVAMPEYRCVGKCQYTAPSAAPVQDERDWSLLEATQESLREHMAEIKRLKAIIEAAEKQEPVAWLYDFLNPDNRDEVIRNWTTQDYDDIEREKGFNVRPLYTTPPAAQRKEWQRLTDDEIKETIGSLAETPIKGYTRKLFDQIEAKLKEKNT